MARTGLTLKISIDGVRPTLAALSTLPKTANDELRDASAKLAETLSSRVRTAAAGEGRQAPIIPVKVRRDRLPVIEAGGTARIGRNRKPAYKLLFGSEFGSNVLRQFKPHLGRGSYWFFRTVEDQQATIARAWDEAAQKIIRKFEGSV